jgi:TRAP-type C4-dicarboxylate transport system permease small subunit
MSFVYSAVPFSCLIMSLRLIGDTVRVIQTKGKCL